MLEMQIHHGTREVLITATPASDEDLVPVALAQALLSEGLSQIICDVNYPAEVLVGSPLGGALYTQAGLEAQIAPLLPLGSQYTRGESVDGESD